MFFYFIRSRVLGAFSFLDLLQNFCTEKVGEVVSMMCKIFKLEEVDELVS